MVARQFHGSQNPSDRIPFPGRDSLPTPNARREEEEAEQEDGEGVRGTEKCERVSRHSSHRASNLTGEVVGNSRGTV